MTGYFTYVYTHRFIQCFFQDTLWQFTKTSFGESLLLQNRMQYSRYIFGLNGPFSISMLNYQRVSGQQPGQVPFDRLSKIRRTFFIYLSHLVRFYYPSMPSILHWIPKIGMAMSQNFSTLGTKSGLVQRDVYSPSHMAQPSLNPH